MPHESNWPTYTAMLRAYLDDSSDETANIVAVAAGWVASADTWVAFNQAWEKALLRADPELSEFHAADCNAAQGEFLDWEIERRDTLRDELTGLIESYDLNGLACAINIRDAQVAIENARALLCQRPGETGHKIPVGFLLCMQYCLGQAYLMVPEQERLRIVFDNKVGANGRVRELDCLLGQSNLIAAKYIARYMSKYPAQFLDSACRPGIQAADMLAYEIKRVAERQISLAPEENRQWYKRLIVRVLHARFYCDSNEVGQLISEWKDLGL